MGIEKWRCASCEVRSAVSCFSLRVVDMLIQAGNLESFTVHYA